MRLLIAIPALNEGQRIRSTVERCLEARGSTVENRLALAHSSASPCCEIKCPARRYPTRLTGSTLVSSTTRVPPGAVTNQFHD